MTPLESGLLHNLGFGYLLAVEQLSIVIFFYGACSSLVVCGSSTSSITGLFVVLFSASVVIFAFVFFSPSPKPLISQQDLIPQLDRRRGFSNRVIAAMFVTTIVNFLLSSLNAGAQVAGIIVFIRTALILDIDYPLSEKRGLVNNALQNVNIVHNWAAILPVSIMLSLSDPGSIHAR